MYVCVPHARMVSNGESLVMGWELHLNPLEEQVLLPLESTP